MAAQEAKAAQNNEVQNLRWIWLSKHKISENIAN